MLRGLAAGSNPAEPAIDLGVVWVTSRFVRVKKKRGGYCSRCVSSDFLGSKRWEAYMQAVVPPSFTFTV